MSKANDFRLYAEEAMRWARNSPTAGEQLVLINLARTWTQAAERDEHSVVVKELSPEPRAP